MNWIGFIQRDYGGVEDLGNFFGTFEEALSAARIVAKNVGLGCVGVVRYDVGLEHLEEREKKLVGSPERLLKEAKVMPKGWVRRNVSETNYELLRGYFGPGEENGIISEGRVVRVEKGAGRVGPEAWRPE